MSTATTIDPKNAPKVAPAPAPAIQAPLPPTPYRVPECELGQQVLWFPHGTRGNAPHIGFVTKRGHDSVCLSILHPNNHNFMIRDGVRHVSDPRARQAELVEQGAWEHTPATLRLQKLEDIVAKLSSVL